MSQSKNRQATKSKAAPTAQPVVALPDCAAVPPAERPLDPKYLLGAFALLVVLTGVTTLVAGVDLGSSGNFAVAMSIAALQATLVAAIYMRLYLGQRLHLLLFLSGVSVLVLFLAFVLIDTQETQTYVDLFRAAQAAAAAPTGN